ncbi:MAG: hypothetical protein MRJ93_10685 [Nitrososphaeraceae archaeon]|nr:hypothetical protein [Nitrososphaeraceae archaeon]
MNRIYSLLSLGFLVIGVGILPGLLSEINSILQDEGRSIESLNWQSDLNEYKEGD